MSVPFQVQNLDAQQADGNILLTWTAVQGATSYVVQRSSDGGASYTTVATPSLPQYLDSLPGIGIQFYYQVAGVNGDGTGFYSTAVSAVAAPPGEMSLGELRLRSQETADRVGSQFVSTSEWNAFIRLAMYELYDLLITAYEDYGYQTAYFFTNGSTQYYALPDGATNYLGGTLGGTSGAPAQAFYKLLGVDLGINTSNNAWVTLNRYDLIDRNNYVYPNSTSTIYGVYNAKYRLVGNTLGFIPIPAGNQQMRILYAPRLPSLLADTDLTTIGYSGWLRYVIVRAAIYALNKEEGTDTTRLTEELVFLKKRIEDSAVNRDAGQPDTISDTRKSGIYGGNGFGSGFGGNAGW